MLGNWAVKRGSWGYWKGGYSRWEVLKSSERVVWNCLRRAKAMNAAIAESIGANPQMPIPMTRIPITEIGRMGRNQSVYTMDETIATPFMNRSRPT